MTAQWEAAKTNDNVDFVAFCSRQLGKSWWALSIALAEVIKGKRVFYFGPVADKLKDIVNDNISPMLHYGPENLIRRVKSEYRWLCDSSGGELRLYSLERAHVDAARGVNADLFIMEEGCFITSEAFKYAYESVVDAMRLIKDSPLILVTTPSADELHYVHTNLLPRCEAADTLAHYTIYDNPFLNDKQIERARSRVTEETWRREYLAEVFRSTDYTAVPEYEDVEHEFTPPEFAHWLTCIDFGGSMDPHGIALCYMEPKTDLLRVYREALIPINTSIAKIVEVCQELETCIPRYAEAGENPWDGREWNAGDVKGSHTRIADCKGQVSVELAALDFMHTTPEKGPGSFDAHLQAVRVAFKNKRIAVHKDCKIMREHLVRGRLNKQKTDFDRLEDSKGVMHHCDMIAALMYGYKIRRTDDPTPPHEGRTLATHFMRKEQMQIAREMSKMFGEDD